MFTELPLNIHGLPSQCVVFNLSCVLMGPHTCQAFMVYRWAITLLLPCIFILPGLSISAVELKVAEGRNFVIILSSQPNDVFLFFLNYRLIIKKRERKSVFFTQGFAYVCLL